ncbi:BEN domain-containing protein 5-like [Cotesia typhae]|uniref:BEN domain-containing protein 5-like n=1 Tax=Cotesia typhae TaxID=2053667 RepID=UPI003D69C39E
MIHLGRGIWLPQATFNNDIYTAGSSLAMVVKNIAVSVFGVEYLKSHSVKGKGSNKTKSIPRPAIDPTKALAIRDIFEYYLKTERKMTGQALMNEVDLYEEYIRQKISDLLRPPRQANKNNKKSEASQKNVTHDKNDVPAAASGDMNPELNTTNPTNNTHDNQLTSSEKSSVGDSSSSEGSSGSSNEESKSASDDSIE